MKMVKVVFLATLAVVFSLASLFFAAPGAYAQSLERGEIRGFVYDTSHSIVLGAKVTISNPSTGYKREMTTDADGVYDFAQLLPGTYKIQAEAEGFASTIITDVVVEIGASLGLDITLPIKGQTQTVTVSAAETGPVDTSTAGINQVINSRDLETLPLSGRDYRDLAQLSSSAQVVPGLRGGIRLGGQQSDYLGIVVDGQDTFNNYFGEIFGSLETKNFTVPLEAVQEFQVVTDGFAPEFGRATGGLVNVVTKSGTNQLHGEAHDYYRGSDFTTNDALGEPPNIATQNQFGGSVGFPIHKDRQFLFLATDAQLQNGPLVTQFCSPGAGQAACLAELPLITGPVFANCAPGSCNPGTATTPGQVPLPSNVPGGTVLPSGCGTPAAGDLVLKDCYGVSSIAGFQGASNQFQNLFTILGHYDYQFSPANHFSVRSYFTRNHTNGFSGAQGQNEIPQAFDNTEDFTNKGAAAVFSLNTVLGRKVNEIRISLSDEVRERNSNSQSPGLSISDGGFSALSVGSAFNYGIGQRYYLPINNQDGKFEAADNFNYSFGKHDMKFGGDSVTFEDRKDSFVGWGAGEYDYFSIAAFNSGVTGGPTGCGEQFTCLLSQGAALNGLPLSFKGPATTLFPNYQSDLGLYWQDKWQVTPSLTVTYGLRWDGTWNPQPQTPLYGNTVLVGQGTGSHASPVPQRVPADFNQWGPRIGVAWNVRHGAHPTVVRGAWGLYYALTVGIFMPTAGAGKLTHCIGSCLFPDSGNVPGVVATTAVGFPYINPSSTPLGVNQLCGTQFGCPDSTSGGGYVDPAFKNPRVSSFTGGIEQSLPYNLQLTATFSYVHSDHLRTGGYDSEEAWQRNYVITGTDPFGRSILQKTFNYTGGALTSEAPTPLDNTLPTSNNETASFSYGNYESLVINLTKRFSNHFQVFANYIWSQNKDNGASERDTDTYFGQQDPLNLAIDYGRNGLDITNQFKAAGVYELPWGFEVSSSVIAHTGVPFPLYIAEDINGDEVSDLGHNNDRPTFTNAAGKTSLLGRYPFDQPGYFQWDGRIQKDVRLRERLHVVLSGDFFNLTNRGNLYSNPNNPNTATISLTALTGCTPNFTPTVAAGFTGSVTGPAGLTCGPLTAATMPRVGVNGFRAITEIAPGSTPFAFQAGVKFVF
ncbi:MAG TPA: carboxypeptidase regulatory-like domain-containing protein [Candidatus Acidoferrales bacterium]